MAPIVPCVAPGFCGSFRLLCPWWLLVAFVASGFWLSGCLSFSCLLASLVHGSSGSSGFFGSYGSFGSCGFSLLWLLRLHIYTYVYVYIYISINQSIYLSFYLSICLSMYLTLSYSILPYLTLSFPYLTLSYPILFLLFYLSYIANECIMTMMTLCKGEAPRPVFFLLESYVGTAWVLSIFIYAVKAHERYRVILWTPLMWRFAGGGAAPSPRAPLPPFI